MIYREMQHKVNPVHLYCRLLEVGISSKKAGRLVCFYEKTLFRFVIRRVLKLLIRGDDISSRITCAIERTESKPARPIAVGRSISQ
jgi:hypothetical protein